MGRLLSTLHLGVIDVPYAFTADMLSTGDVAEYLETHKDGSLKYGVMTHFYELNADKVVDHLADSVAGTIENILAGAPTTGDPFAEAMGHVEEDFRRYIDEEGITASSAPGVPTQAALDGVSHRFKGKKGPRRPSFRDTGLYQASFRAWVE